MKNIDSILLKAWSSMFSSKWTPENPVKGQCGITYLVINDLNGSEIRKTKLSGGWHFYNFINNKRYDFTSSQFEDENVISNRDAVFSDTNKQQYSSLKNRVESLMDKAGTQL